MRVAGITKTAFGSERVSRSLRPILHSTGSINPGFHRLYHPGFMELSFKVFK